jgi:hypothetical protein
MGDHLPDKFIAQVLRVSWLVSALTHRPMNGLSLRAITSQAVNPGHQADDGKEEVGFNRRRERHAGKRQGRE